MGKLTEQTPKPLLKIGRYSLIEHLILKLKQHGFTEIVINVSYLANILTKQLGDGSAYGVSIQFSIEEKEPLEWGGGVLKALPLLGDEPFLVMSGDLWTDYPFMELRKPLRRLGHLVLVDDPEYHPDFALEQGFVSREGENKMTYGGIGVFSSALFEGMMPGKISFRDAVFPAIETGKMTGEVYTGTWFNVGTPGCLDKVKKLSETELEDAVN